MSINKKVIDEIKKLKFRCMNGCEGEMTFDEARTHYRGCIQNKLKQLKQEGIKNKEGIKNQNQEGKKNKQEISISRQESLIIKPAKAGSSIPSSIQEESSKEQRTDDRLEENVRVSNKVKIYQKRENERGKGTIFFIFFVVFVPLLVKIINFVKMIMKKRRIVLNIYSKTKVKIHL